VAATEKRKRVRELKHQNYLDRLEQQKKFLEEKENRKKQKTEETMNNEELATKRKRARKRKEKGLNSIIQLTPEYFYVSLVSLHFKFFKFVFLVIERLS